jgi:hypothetical protein
MREIIVYPDKIVLLFNRGNLLTQHKNKKIDDIDMVDFKGWYLPMRQANILIFVDDDGSSKCFKHREFYWSEFKFEDLTDEYKKVWYNESLKSLY